MDPLKLEAVDSRVTYATRFAGFGFSNLVAAIMLLIRYGIIHISGAYLIACWPLAVSMLTVGYVDMLWNPHTWWKAKLYLQAYTVLGALLSIFIFGFPTLIVAGWIAIMIAADIYFNRKQAMLSFIVFVVSVIAWFLLHRQHISLATIINYMSDFIAILLVYFMVSNILRLTFNSLKELEISHKKQEFEHKQLKSLVNSMTDGVIAVDENIKIILFNAAALNVLDINTLTSGVSLGDVLKPLDKNNQSIDIVSLVQQCRLPITNQDYHMKYSDGSTVNLYLGIAPVHMGYGAPSDRGYVLLIRDISREKSLEEEKDEFISIVSHELRTPVAIIEGSISNAQLMTDKIDVDPTIKKTLKTAHDQALYLADIVNDLATLSRAERGISEVDITEINVHEFIDKLARDYKLQIESKGLQLNVEVESTIGIIRSNELYVREIIQNFITNSIKYTNSGSITISAVAKDSGVCFSVSDTGIGIGKADQERVFDKFFRSEDYRTRKTSGTGLGLYTAMKLSNLINATLGLHSELGKGSTFTVLVPNIDKTLAPS
jgi:signal transduction histidine kinase